MPFVYFSLILLVGSFVVSYILIPKISTIAKISNFNSKPNHRSSHTESIPNIGGVAFYVTLMLSFYFIQKYDSFNTLFSILPGLTIIFIIGLKDDLVIVAPTTKLIAQISSGVFLVFHSSFELLNFKGFLWIFEINYLVGILIVVFVNVLIINALNLIDGIYGLAGIVSIVILSSFFVIFLMLKKYFLCSISIVLIGSILAFLRFNISNSKKIFMGDTGSMLIGFVISILTLRLIAMPSEGLKVLDFQFQNIPFLIFAILSIPLMDLVRVFILRILKGKSPFEADRSHLHHILLDYFKTTHLQTSLIIGFLNLIIVLSFSILIHKLYQIQLFAFVFLLFAVYIYVLSKIQHKIV